MLSGRPRQAPVRNSAVDFAFHAITVADIARLGRIRQRDLLALMRRALILSGHGDLQGYVASFVDRCALNSSEAGEYFRTALSVWLNGQDLVDSDPMSYDVEPKRPNPVAARKQAHEKEIKAPAIEHDWMTRADAGFE